MRRPAVAKDILGEPVSLELEPLLLQVYEQLASEGSDHRGVGVAVRRLLEFLSSPSGRTNANCWAADLFFALDDGWGSVSWEHLPVPLHDIISDIGGALHDTIAAPAIAENCDSTPEQLLHRLHLIEIAGRAV